MLGKYIETMEGTMEVFKPFRSWTCRMENGWSAASYAEDGQKFRSRMDIVPLKIEMDTSGLMDKIQALPCVHYITEDLPNETYTLLRDFPSG